MNMLPLRADTMTSLEIADLLEKRHDKVKQSIDRLVERGVIVQPPMGDVQTLDSLGRPRTEKVYKVIERDSYIVVAQLSPEFTARLVDFWQTHKNAAQALPNFADPVIAARAWADEREARQLAERTKAQIGSRREATAMNAASQAVKKLKRLEIELDRSHQFATVKRMEKHYGRKFPWHPLKKAAEAMDAPSVDIDDANYGSVKAYRAEVWREVYGIEIPEVAPPE